MPAYSNVECRRPLKKTVLVCAGDADRDVLPPYTARLTLTEEMLGRPLEDVLVRPFLRQYGRKTGCELGPEHLVGMSVDGACEPVSDLSLPAGSVLRSAAPVVALLPIATLRRGAEHNLAEQHVEVKSPAPEGEFDGPMADAGDASHVAAPMPGAIEKVLVSNGSTVKAGDDLFVVCAMKMEVNVKATKDGTISGVTVALGDKVVESALLCKLE